MVVLLCTKPFHIINAYLLDVIGLAFAVEVIAEAFSQRLQHQLQRIGRVIMLYSVDTAEERTYRNGDTHRDKTDRQDIQAGRNTDRHITALRHIDGIDECSLSSQQPTIPYGFTPNKHSNVNAKPFLVGAAVFTPKTSPPPPPCSLYPKLAVSFFNVQTKTQHWSVILCLGEV